MRVRARASRRVRPRSNGRFCDIVILSSDAEIETIAQPIGEIERDLLAAPFGDPEPANQAFLWSGASNHTE